MKRKKSAIDREIENLEAQLEGTPDQTSENYDQLLKVYDKLLSLKYKKMDSKKKLDPNTILTVGASLVELTLIMTYEKFSPIVTKAFTRLIRPRI